MCCLKRSYSSADPGPRSTVDVCAITSPHPHTNPCPAQVWEYPSPQMFYNAMKRKGWKPEERDMTTVVAIHNQVNETAWHAVLDWERLHSE